MIMSGRMDGDDNEREKDDDDNEREEEGDDDNDFLHFFILQLIVKLNFRHHPF